MQRRRFSYKEWNYTLVARGEAGSLKSALDLVQQLIETNEVQPLSGILEVADCTVTVRAVHSKDGWE